VHLRSQATWLLCPQDPDCTADVGHQDGHSNDRRLKQCLFPSIANYGFQFPVAYATKGSPRGVLN
jgi:hypothetical protein